MMRIPQETLVLLASLYEEFEYATDPTSQKVRRDRLIFDSECKRLYEAEPPSLREQMDFSKYVAAVVIPDVLRQIQSPAPPPSI
jgi:hypothetical protein